MEALGGFAPAVEGAHIEAVEGPEVRGEWLRVRSAPPARFLYYLHGGGYSLGSPFTHRSLVANLAEASGAAVFSLDYRRAPEFPCPAAIEDAVAGWHWLLDAVPPQERGRLVVTGDSAGAGLALAMTMELRHRGALPPAGLVLLSPWTDLALTGASLQANEARDVMVTWPVLRLFARDYLGSMDPLDPRPSPLYGDLAGSPPMLIQVGGDEMLLDDSLRLAAKAREAGVAVTLDVAPGMWHVWQGWARQVPEAAAAVTRISEFLASLP